MSALGKYLKDRRSALNERYREFSIRSVAKRIGIHQSYLSKVERGEHAPLTNERVLALARVLGEDPELLFALSGKLTERITKLILHKPESFLNFVAGIERESGIENSGNSYINRLENRKNELETLTRMLREEINSKIFFKNKLIESQLDMNTVLSNLKDIFICCLDRNNKLLWMGNKASKYFSILKDFVSENNHDSKLLNTVEWSRIDRDDMHWLIKSVPVRNSDNEVERTVYFGFDVSELVEAREELEKSERRWRFALEGAQEGVWDWNAQTNKVFYSRRWKEMLGYEEDEIGDELIEWQSRIHPEDYEAVHGALAQHLAGETPFYEFEHRLRCKDGTYKWVLDRGVIVERSPGGAPLRAIGTHFDVTAKHDAEETIRNNESFLKALLSSIKDGITVLDEDLNITFANEAQRTRFSSQGSLEGRKCYQVFRARSSPCEECPALACLRVRSQQTAVIQNANKFGLRNMELTCHPILDSETGLSSGVVEISRDITERIEMETELRFERNRYESIFQKNPTVQLLINPDTGMILDCNEIASSFFQFAKEDLCNKHISELSASSADSVKMELEQAKNDELGIFNSVCRLRDGNTREVEVRVAVIHLDDSSLLHAIVIDMTERNQALREVAQKRNQLETLIENLPDVVCVKDAEGRLIAVSRQLKEVLGLQGLDLAGKTVESLRGVVDRELHDALNVCETRDLHVESTGGRYRSRVQVRTADGDGRIFDVLKVRTLHEDGMRAGLTVIARDITEMCENNRRHALLASIIDNSPNICVIKDLDLRVIATNQVFATAAGKKLEDLIGKNDAEIFGLSPDEHPVKGYMEDERIVQSLASGQFLSREETVIYPGGAVHTVQTRKFPVFDTEGNLIATANISTDMTETAVARKRLADAEETCRLLVSRAPIGIYAATPDGRYLQVNDALADMYGYESAGDMLGKIRNSREIYADPSDRERLLRLLELMDTVAGFESRMKRKDGGEVWTSRTVRAIRDVGGRITHYEAFVENIQDRKDAELGEENSHRLLLDVLERLEAGVYVINPADKRIMFANRYLTEAVGRDLVGLNAPQSLLMQPEMCTFLAQDPHFAMPGATKTCELQFVNGKWYYCTAKLGPWIGGAMAMVIVAMDITQVKLAAEMREDIDRIMRHDLRSPLNAIINIPELLAQSCAIGREDRELLLAIKDSGMKMLRLIDASLSLYRLETGSYVLDLGCVCVEDELKKIFNEISMRYIDKKIIFEVLNEDCSDRKTYINADVVIFPFLLSNLISNAFEASDIQSKVSVSIAREDFLRITVHNDREVEESIRDVFFNKYVTFGKKSGTGLGTYSAKLIVEAHGGTIKMQSSSLEGTYVSFIMPKSCLLNGFMVC